MARLFKSIQLDDFNGVSAVITRESKAFVNGF